MLHRELVGLCLILFLGDIRTIDFKKWKIEYVSSSGGVLVDNLNDHMAMLHIINIKQLKQHSILEMSPSANYTVQMYIEISDAIDQFNEVSQNYDDNRFVLESHPQSDYYYFRKSMKFITTNFCKHPLPKQYNIILDSYKNRATMANSISCKTLNISNLCTQSRYFPDRVMYNRSINDECFWKENQKYIKSDEILEQLDENLNSIYCTENSPILNRYFNLNINTNIQIVSYPKCEAAKARCIDCHILRCKSNKICCRTVANCLSQEPCLTYYSPGCSRSYEDKWHSDQPRCTRGTTYKFTLSPEFDFKENEFLCYLERKKSRPKITIQLTFLDRNLHFLRSKSMKFGGHLHDSNVLEFKKIEIEFVPSSIESLKNIILEKRKFEFYIYALKQSQEFDSTAPNIHKLFSKSFIKVQMSKPFLYNTETWSAEKCHINISSIYKAQPIYNPKSKTPIELVHKRLLPGNEERQSIFTYSMIPKGLETPKVQIKIPGKTSLLSLYFCRIKKLHSPLDLKANINSVDETTWYLHINGHITEDITFFSIAISNIWSAEEIFYKSDVVVSKDSVSSKSSGYFNISFQISVTENDVNKSLFVFLLKITQCEEQIYRRLVFLNQSYSSDKMKDFEEIDRSVDISNFILILFLATICICFFYFLLLAFQTARRSSAFSKKKGHPLQFKSSQKMNYKLFIKIIFYMTLKLFYTVSFTLSLILSVCLSLNVFTIHSNTSSNPLNSKHVATNAFSSLEASECHNIPKLLARHFLFNLKQQLSSQEIVRSTSAQSTQIITKQIIENISMVRIHGTIGKLLRTYDNSVQIKLQSILDIYVDTFKNLNDSRWLSLMDHWNSSTSDNLLTNSEYFQPYLKKDYLRISNLMEIYGFSSVLQSCEYFPNRMSRHHQHVKRALKVYPAEFRFNQSVNANNYKRYFTSYKQTSVFSNTSSNNDNPNILKKSNNFFNIDVFKIRLVFMLIDAALILYRCYWTYIDIRQMWNPKKQLIQLNQIILKTNHNSSHSRTKSNIVHWTKHHHLECLVSAHLAIAAIIIIMSIICINLLVLLTSRDHSNWLSKKAGNTIRIRSLKDVKDELSKLNNGQMNSVHRQWHNQKLSRLKQLMGYRKEAINRIMYFELFLNYQYFYELCNLQNLSTIPKLSLDFCQSFVPVNTVIPEALCDSSLNNAPFLSFNFTSYYSSKTILYLYQPIYVLLNVLALILFATSVVGMLKVIRRVIENKMFSGHDPVRTILRTHNQMIQASLKNPKNLIQMKQLRFIPNVYDSNLEPPNPYQCKLDNSVVNVNTPV